MQTNNSLSSLHNNNNSNSTLSDKTRVNQGDLTAKDNGLTQNGLPTKEGMTTQDNNLRTNNTDSILINRRQSSAYMVSINSDQQQTAVTYSRESQTTHSVERTSAIQEPPALLDGARNILHFIEQRVASEHAAGAPIEDLATLLEQGLSGFIQGYDEAMDILGGEVGEKEMLNDTVNTSVSLLYQQVVDGIADLRHTYLGEERAETTDASTQQTTPLTLTAETPTSTNAQSYLASNGSQLSTAIESPLQDLLAGIGSPSNSQLITLLDSLEKIEGVKEYAAQYAETQKFEFTLTTADGDSITIIANRASQASAASYTGDNSQANINQKSDSQSFSFHINGDLDEGEITAINNLLQQVMSLSEEFYNGDVGAAYEAALDMDYDSSEITSYALQLKQTESYQVAAAYDAVAGNNSPVATDALDLHALFEQIGDYAQQVLQSITEPDNYQHIQYAQLIDIIAKQLDQQINSPYDYSFSDTIADARQNTQL
jgi:hypothetical protein